MTLEYWKHDAGTDSVASLVIPAALGRARTFDLDATLLVHVLPEAVGGFLELTVEADEDCRVRAKANCKGARVRSLAVEARQGAAHMSVQAPVSPSAASRLARICAHP